ncbi:retrovirus-related Pol polyprotein from transposon 297 [Trichonephila clavipes]|nr:retrovirus-related Pol polyprotein from transposon 297 [Trichonephila clavipes]
MCIGQAEPLNEGHLCVISDTSGCLDDQQETSESQMNCSLMMSPELVTNRETSYPNYSGNFLRLFTKTDKSTAAKTNVKHRIFTGDHSINQRAYRVSTERRIIHEEVQKMLDEGIVQPSESPWSSPIVLVRKKKTVVGVFCVDYRKLNSVTKKTFISPRIDDTLDCLKGAMFFSSMDLRSGYWQIEIDEADREKTAFITPKALYEFKVMPFGLCNAPATFERMMDNLLRHFKWTMCLCYLDDIIVFSETFEDHLIRLRLVLKCLQEAGLKLNSKEVSFAAQEVKILGHLVSSNGVRPDPDKIKAVRNFPTQRIYMTYEVFLGLCSYFRRFIKGFCYLAEPLQSLLKSGVEFHWGPEEVEAFNSLKKALTSDPVLGMYDERASTEIHTDASGNPVEEETETSGQIFSSHDEYEPCDGTEKGSRPCEIKTFEQLIQNEEFRFIDGILCRKNFDPDGKLWLPVIPKHLRADILRHFHDAPTAGHLGFAKTYDRIRKRFYWLECTEMSFAIAPFHRIGIDLLGRFKKSAHGNKWIIVCTDYSTRYAITKALPTAEVDEIAKFLLEEIVLRHGAPRVIYHRSWSRLSIQTCFLSRRLV